MKTSRQEQSELRMMVEDAIQNNVLAPGSIIEHILNNNWKYELPTRQTIINILHEKNIEYVKGGWMKKSETQ